MATFSSSRLLKALLVLLIIFSEIKLYRWWTETDSSRERTPSWVAGSTSKLGLGSKKESFLRKRIAVVTSFGAHDVFMSLVDTLESILLPPSSSPPHSPASSLPNTAASSSPVRVYTRGLRYGLGTQVLSELGIYSAPYYGSDQALEDIDAGWEGKGADVVVLGTCEIDMEYYSDSLWKIWQSRPDDRKFSLVCIVHNSGDFGWAEKYSGDWARTDSLRIMPISPHVSQGEFENLVAWSDEPARHHLGYSKVPIHAHIPILPIERLRGFNAHGKHTGEYIFSPEQDGLGELRAKPKSRSKQTTEDDGDEFWKVETSEEGEVVLGGGLKEGLDTTWGRRDGKVLRDAIIQGNFETARRNYIEVFADLEAEIALDPSAWGYLPPASSSAPFVPASTRNNFVLHLAGNGNADFIPSRLSKHVVKVHKGLSYPDFFSLMGSMDVVLPSFTATGSYYDHQASSTVAMAMQCEVPLLVTPRILRAYSYLTSATTILRPPTIGEIQALKILRTSVFSGPARGYSHTAERSYTHKIGLVSSGEEMEEHASVRREAEEMVQRGWTTNEKGWRRFKKGIREGNEVVVRKMVLER
ncbi:hypothetical protein BDY24DRAFT_440530 [Mrakia frigida]|uniref:uncharacterized protein n=1 Tax=Mrakia frigida TaxID=29902 RepID=UPI003FCC0158